MAQGVPEFSMRTLLHSGKFPAYLALQRRPVLGVVWLLGCVLGGALLVNQSYRQSVDDFETGARIAHRLLSQRAVQHEAVLATLSLMQPDIDPRLPAIYPQFLQMWRKAPGASWAAPGSLATALEQASRQAGRPQLALAELAAGKFWIVMAPAAGTAEPAASYALEVSLPLMVPWADWPFGEQAESAAARHTRVWLEHEGARWALHGAPDRGGLRTLEFRKHLAAPSQPFDMVAQRSYGWRDLPWGWMPAWCGGWSLAVRLWWSGQQQRQARRRAEELLRLGQVSRLNALGEMAAGLAHELNQPLTAVLANTQAAGRLLADDGADLPRARTAMEAAATQARRAAEVVARLRRAIERPDARALAPVLLLQAAREVMVLLQPECERRAVQVRWAGSPEVQVLADGVALEQIVHNLVMNALAALEQVAGRERVLTLSVHTSGSAASLHVQDNGPGVPAHLRERLFEPFVSACPGGLGLGLSLCDTLAGSMGGQVRYAADGPGATFVLELQQAPAALPGAGDLA